jgi:hypothetical protein
MIKDKSKVPRFVPQSRQPLNERFMLQKKNNLK